MSFTATFVQSGKAVDYTPTTAVAAGAVVVQGNLVGVAKEPIPANSLGGLAVEGVFDFPKTAGVGSGIAAGAQVYWDATDGVATVSANNGATPPVAYPSLGKTVQACADGDATVRVRLHQ
jgi:predicted RecA/RadA family phage recombinase